MIRRTNRFAFSLLEVIAALIIASTLAVITLHSVRAPAETGKQRACDLTRQTLQNDAERYQRVHGAMPSRDLAELAPESVGGIVPRCPATGDAYRIDRNGVVECPTHKSTR